MEIGPIVPFEPIRTTTVPAGDEWIAQIKWDGVRMLTYFDGKDVRLFNRKLNERTLQYPEIANIHSYCKAKSVILDGEIVALKDGKPSFHEIMRRDSVRTAQKIPPLIKSLPIVYMIFDLLFYNGNWLIDKKLSERQEVLSKIICSNETIQIVANYPDPHSLYEVMVQHQMEGILIKDINSKYQIKGKDKRWMKKKVYRDLVAVVGGVTKRGNVVNSVLLGLYDEDGQLWYIGHSGTGKLTQDDWRTLTALTDSLHQESRTFVNVPSRSNDAIWLMPVITVKIHYMEWTREKNLRQPSIQSVVSAAPEECLLDQL